MLFLRHSKIKNNSNWNFILKGFYLAIVGSWWDIFFTNNPVLGLKKLDFKPFKFYVFWKLFLKIVGCVIVTRVSLSNFYFLIYLLKSEFSISFSSLSFPSLVSVNKIPNAGYLVKSNFLITNIFSKSCLSISKSK